MKPTEDAYKQHDRISHKPSTPNGVALGGLRSEFLGFTHRTPIKMITHLCSNSATLDDIDIQELTSTIDSALNSTKNPATKFKRNDKIEQQLEKVGISENPQHHLALFKAAIKHTGTTLLRMVSLLR